MIHAVCLNNCNGFSHYRASLAYTERRKKSEDTRFAHFSDLPTACCSWKHSIMTNRVHGSL